jgi:osmotically-inducible protein OsmY
MNIRHIVPQLIATVLLLPGAVPASALAAEPTTSVNSTSLAPGDDNVPTAPSQAPDDMRVTQQIREALQSDGTLAPDVSLLVRVATNGQAVVLRGALPSTRDIERVQTLAEGYCGARQVINELTVIDH